MSKIEESHKSLFSFSSHLEEYHKSIAGPIAKFFFNCPDNAFQRIGAIARNGAKLFVVGTSASLIGTGVTYGLLKARKALDKSFAGEAEDVPIFSTSAAYGVYMAVSATLGIKYWLALLNNRF